jgi:hypothetical protein
MDNPNYVGSDAYGIGREYKLTAADVAKLGPTGATVVLGDLPQGAITDFVRIKHTVQFAGAGTCTVKVQTVDLGSPTLAVVNDNLSTATAFNVMQAVSATAMVSNSPTTGNVEPFDKKTAVAVLVSGTTLQNMTAGSVSIFHRYRAVAPAPPLRFDTTAQTPRAMPAY